MRGANQTGRWTRRAGGSHMQTTCGKTERTGRHLSAAAVSGPGSSSTFPAFPEIGTVRDSRNFRNDPGGGGGVETGWDIKVSVVEWCYQRTFIFRSTTKRERKGGWEGGAHKITVFYPPLNGFRRLLSSFIVPMVTCCRFACQQHAASCLQSAL